MKRSCLVVLSMHRSGSSALTRTLSLCGADLPRTLVPATRNDNDLGFWESQKVVDLNDAFLRAIGSHWYDFAPPALEEVAEELKSAFVRDAVRTLRDEFGTASRFVLKDPRLCLLLPLWQAALEELGIAARYVLALRNPLDVAASLSRRNQILQGESLLSWLRFELGAERATRDAPRVFLHYDDLLADWRGAMDRVTRALALDWDGPEGPAAAEIDAFLSPDWRHNQAGEVALTAAPDMPDWVCESYVILRGWCGGQDAPAAADLARLDAIRSDFEASAPVYRKLAGGARALSVEGREAGRRLNELQARTEAQRKQLEEARAQLAAEQAAHGAVRTALAETRAQAEAQQAGDRDRIAKAEEDLARSQSALTALQQQQAEAETGLAEARTRLAEAEAALAETRARAEADAGEGAAALAAAQEALQSSRAHAVAEGRRSSRAYRERLLVYEAEIAELRRNLRRCEQQMAGTRAALRAVSLEASGRISARLARAVSATPAPAPAPASRPEASGPAAAAEPDPDAARPGLLARGLLSRKRNPSN